MLTNSKNEKESVFHITKNQTILNILGYQEERKTTIGPKQKIIIIETETRKGRSRSTS
jgi:hypothetical protein